MKFKKGWKNIVIVLSVILLILIIYNCNGTNKKEHFQESNQNNNNADPNQHAQLKKQIAAFANVSEDRVSDLKVEGVVPSITVSFYILPRTVDDTSASTLLDIENDLNDRKKNMGFDFTVEGQTLKFINMNVDNLEKSEETQYQRLMNKFVDKGLDEQIQQLRDIQRMVKYDNPMDRFYRFTKVGDLVVDSQKKNEIPAEGQEGSLEEDVPPIEQLNNNQTVEQFTLNQHKFY